MSDDDDNGNRAFDQISLEITAFGEDKDARRRLINQRLQEAVAQILQGRFPDTPRTKFCENMGGGGGP